MKKRREIKNESKIQQTDSVLTLNKTPFSDKQLNFYFNKKKLPRKLKKQINNYFFGKGLFKRNGILIYDETPSIDFKGIENLYTTIKKVDFDQYIDDEIELLEPIELNKK